MSGHECTGNVTPRITVLLRKSAPVLRLAIPTIAFLPFPGCIMVALTREPAALYVTPAHTLVFGIVVVVLLRATVLTVTLDSDTRGVPKLSASVCTC